jgi:hypothetical protein
VTAPRAPADGSGRRPRQGSASAPRPPPSLAPRPAKTTCGGCASRRPKSLRAIARLAREGSGRIPRHGSAQPPRPAAALAVARAAEPTYGHCASRPLPREREHHHREHHHPMAFCQSRYSCTPGHEAKPQPLATYHRAMSGDFLPIESQTGSVAAGNVYIPRHSVVGQFGCYSFAKDTSISARRCSRNATSSSLRPW